MKILHKTYNDLLCSASVPPETGGLIGGHNGIVDTAFFDTGIYGENGGVYRPNVNVLNLILSNWNKDKILFFGIFHTHAPNWSDLSHDDKMYIDLILNSMPDYVNELFFPLVFPGDRIKSFVARKSENGVCVMDDIIEIVEKR